MAGALQGLDRVAKRRPHLAVATQRVAFQPAAEGGVAAVAGIDDHLAVAVLATQVERLLGIGADDAGECSGHDSRFLLRGPVRLAPYWPLAIDLRQPAAVLSCRAAPCVRRRRRRSRARA